MTPSPTCPYCGHPAELVTGEVIYPLRPDLANKRLWRCKPCGAHVGCHAGTTTPFGPLANASHREAKIQAHAAFDPLWRAGWMRRAEAYAWLAEQLGVEREACHVGMFSFDTCQRVVAVCRAYIAAKCRGDICLYGDDFDPVTAQPLGPRCSQPAAEVIFWMDGRFSPCCAEHGFTILTPETRLLVFSVQPLTEGGR